MTDAELPLEGSWRAVPLAWHTDLDHGGRWWSLTTAQREWLWTNPDAATCAARLDVRPGAAFVDAGGGEECYPDVRGVPDHGDAWTRVWQGSRLAAHVDTAYGRLDREVAEDPTLRLDYRLRPDAAADDRPPGPTGPITHAVHLLLELSDDARLVVPGTPAVTLLDEPAPGADTRGTWPVVAGVDLSRLGPDDGTARCAVLRGLAGPGPATAYVVDGDAALGLRWDSADARPGLMLWRNLGGWPAEHPYRSIGVEPLVECDAAARWWLEVTAYERD